MSVLSAVKTIERLLADTQSRESNLSLLQPNNGFYDSLLAFCKHIEDPQQARQVEEYLESRRGCDGKTNGHYFNKGSSEQPTIEDGRYSGEQYLDHQESTEPLQTAHQIGIVYSRDSWYTREQMTRIIEETGLPRDIFNRCVDSRTLKIHGDVLYRECLRRLGSWKTRDRLPYQKTIDGFNNTKEIPYREVTKSDEKKPEITTTKAQESKEKQSVKPRNNTTSSLVDDFEDKSDPSWLKRVPREQIQRALAENHGRAVVSRITDTQPDISRRKRTRRSDRCSIISKGLTEEIQGYIGEVLKIPDNYQPTETEEYDDRVTPDNLCVSRDYVDGIFRNFNGYRQEDFPNSIKLSQLGRLIIQYIDRITSLKAVIDILYKQRDSYSADRYPEIHEYLSGLIERLDQIENSGDRSKGTGSSSSEKAKPAKRAGKSLQVKVDESSEDLGDKDSNDYKDDEETDSDSLSEEDEDLQEFLRLEREGFEQPGSGRHFTRSSYGTSGRRIRSTGLGVKDYKNYGYDKPLPKKPQESETTRKLMEFLKGKSLDKLTGGDLATLKEIGYEVKDGRIMKIPDLSGIDASAFAEDPLWYAVENHSDRHRGNLREADEVFYIFLERTRQLGIIQPKTSRGTSKREKLDYPLQVAVVWKRDHYGKTTDELQDLDKTLFSAVKNLGMEQWINRRAEIAKAEKDKPKEK